MTGDVAPGPAAEFHIHLDPDAAKRVFHAELHPLLIPLDVTRKLIFSPTDLLELPNPESRTCQFLRKIVPFGIRASSNLYGIEGFHLKDVLGTVAVAVPAAVSSEPHHVDVETRGELTRGMTVIDARPNTTGVPNTRVATGTAVAEVRERASEGVEVLHHLLLAELLDLDRLEAHARVLERRDDLVEVRAVAHEDGGMAFGFPEYFDDLGSFGSTIVEAVPGHGRAGKRRR